MECKVVQTAIKKALEEQMLINATVDGLLRMLASKKVNQVEKFIEKKNEFKVKGFTMTLVDVSYGIYPWSDRPLHLYAQFMVKNPEMKAPLTKKEASLVKRYKELIGNTKWDWKAELKKKFSLAETLSADVYNLKNDILFTKTLSWSYSFDDILRDTFLSQGVSLEER